MRSHLHGLIKIPPNLEALFFLMLFGRGSDETRGLDFTIRLLAYSETTVRPETID
jgi:hypothetical protein